MLDILFSGEYECVLPNSEFKNIIKTLYRFSNSVRLCVQQNTYNNQVIAIHLEDSYKPEAYLKIFLRNGKLYSNPGEIINTYRFSQGGFSLAPKVLYFDSRNYFYLVTQRMTGCQGNLLNLNSNQLLIVKQTLDTLHSNVSTNWGLLGKSSDSYSSFEINHLLCAINKVGIVIQDKVIKTWLTRLSNVEQFSFCHGEPILEHLMLDSSRIGLIDWEASGYYHPFIDWSAWVHSLLIYGYYSEAMRIIVYLEKNDKAKLLPFFFAQRLLYSIAYPRNRRIIDERTRQAYLLCVENILRTSDKEQQINATVEFIHKNAYSFRDT
jgi:Phosphotransferase enzyme family